MADVEINSQTVRVPTPAHLSLCQALKNSDLKKKLEELNKDPDEGTPQAAQAMIKKAAEVPEEPKGFTADDLKAMSVKQLKEEITKMGLAMPEHAFDKSDFLEVLQPHARELTAEEEFGKTVTAVHKSLFGGFRDFKEQLKEDARADLKAFNDKFNK